MAQDLPPYPFWPQHVGAFERDLEQLLVRLDGCNHSTEASQKVTEQLFACPEYVGAELPLLRYRAYLLVLHDLRVQGWVPNVRAGRLYLSPPPWAQASAGHMEASAQKQIIRQAMGHERLAQLRQPAVRAFIARMERPRHYQNRAISIRTLVADGSALSAALRDAAAQPDDETQRQAMGEVVKLDLLARAA